MMQKISRIFLILVFFSLGCSRGVLSEVRNNSDFNQLDLNEGGILVFSFSFAENKFQEKPVYVKIAYEKKVVWDFKIEPGEDKIFFFYAKKGKYEIQNLATENYSAAADPKKYRESKDVISDKKWIFEVHPWKINYAGNFFFKDFSEDRYKYNVKFLSEREDFAYSAEINLRKRTTDIDALFEKQPGLKDLKLEILALAVQEEEALNGSVSRFKVRGEDFYPWGIKIGKFVEFLQSQNKKIIILDKNTVIDNTNDKFPIEYIFVDHEKDSLLKKVTLNLSDDSFSKAQVSLNQKYGRAVKEKEQFVWFSSDAKIILSQVGQGCTLVFESLVPIGESRDKK